MTQEELNSMLKKHKLWLAGEEAGERADLRDTNLQRADLQRADLQGADLQWADLRGADLRGADLRDTNLRDTNLRGANLQRANLQGADLRGSTLDRSCWPLWCGSLGAIGDENLCTQLAYHLARLMQNSGMIVTSDIRELANKAPQIERYNLPRIG